jgi:DNA repair protein RecO (recombination protein O)
MIQKTECIVLRAIDYSDQSKIITLFSKEFGKISAIAKGYKKPGNKYASLFETGNCVEAVLYVKPTRQMQVISDGSLRHSFLLSEHTLESYSVLHQILELIRHATEEQDKHITLYNVLASVLIELSKPGANADGILFYFQIRLIGLLGFKPSFLECAYTKKPIRQNEITIHSKKLILVPDLGGICLVEHANRLVHKNPAISPLAYQTLLELSEAKLSDIQNLLIPKRVYSELYKVLDTYIRFHVEHLPPLRSRDISMQLLS